MSRKLTDEERQLWERLSRSVEPLDKRRARKSPPAAGASPKAGKHTRDSMSKESLNAAPPKPDKSPSRSDSRPALAPLHDRTRRRLARGLAAIDARIDLHGMHQDRAFARLVGFLRNAQARGHRMVLVVTGKGNGEGRGVLRQAVPSWLSRPDLRHLVVGFEQAARRHGGEGALYVRVRRLREGRRVSPAP